MDLKKKIGLCFGVTIIILVLIAGCTNQSTSYSDEKEKKETQIGDLVITSSAFDNGENIPIKYSCDGEEISPPLNFSNIPEGTKSMVLILDDPDVQGDEPWVHWIVFNISPNSTGFGEAGIHYYYVGKNSWGDIVYGGPCPPNGEEHRYYFRLYALNITLDLLDGASRQEIDDAMVGHILGQTSLMGKYGL